MRFLIQCQIIVVFWVITNIFSNIAFSADDVSAITLDTKAFQNLERTKNDKVVKVIDPLTIELEKQGFVRLTGLDIPDFSPHDQGPLSESAIKILNDMLAGKEVMVYQTRDRTKGRKNRMGHNLFHIFLNDSESWVQGVLVRLGLARVRTDKSNTELAEHLYELEAQARADKLGLWAFEENRILTPDNAEQFINSFQIVEGRVLSAARKQNNLFLNFGKNWRNDFTVAIASSDLRNFQKSGMNPQNLNGQIIRVRGWIREYNGPYMEIDHAQRIEVIEKQ